MIRHLSFNHKNNWYHYRLHNLKYDKLCDGFTSLRSYLKTLFKNCPNDYFLEGPRSSSLRFKIKDLNLHRIYGHEVCKLAELGLKSNNKRYFDNHSKVEVFMLESDNKTIACEVPIWLKSDEFENFKKVFRSDKPLTGHIDLLRMEDDKIWVWDYKPLALEEKYAPTQVYFYALMLSKRTKINLDKFMCGYFNKEFAFIFKPLKDIKISKQLDGLFDFLR